MEKMENKIIEKQLRNIIPKCNIEDLDILDYIDDDKHINYKRLFSYIVKTLAYTIQYIEMDIARTRRFNDMDDVDIVFDIDIDDNNDMDDMDNYNKIILKNNMYYVRSYKALYKYIRIIKELKKQATELEIKITIPHKCNDMINHYM